MVPLAWLTVPWAWLLLLWVWLMVPWDWLMLLWLLPWDWATSRPTQLWLLLATDWPMAGKDSPSHTTSFSALLSFRLDRREVEENTQRK